nr:SDR family NAD(P)-dependent oxidoreductase [Micromonospora sp. DSM 115978]
RQAFQDGTAELGPVQIVLANAGIGAGGAPVAEEQEWDEVVSVNLTGVWNTGRIAIPAMLEHGQGGSIVLTSSTGVLMGVGIPTAGVLGYTAAKHGVIGLMRSWANFLAPHNIRVNSVAPTAVRTPMAGDGNLQAIME